MKKIIFVIVLLFHNQAFTQTPIKHNNIDNKTTQTTAAPPTVTTPPTTKPYQQPVIPPAPQIQVEEHETTTETPHDNEQCERLSSLSFLPSKGDLFGLTSFSSSYYELDSDQTSIVLKNRSKSYSHLLAYGLTDRVTLGLSIDYIASGNSDLIVNGTTTSSVQLETGVSTPQLAFGLRIFKRGDLSDFWNLNFFYFQNPKTFNERSVYQYVLDSVFTINERVSIKNSFQYVTFSETSALTSTDYFNLIVESQFYFTDNFFIRGALGARFMSSEGFKASTIVFENTIAFTPRIAIGGDVSENVMWSIAISSLHSERGISDSTTDVTGYETYASSTVSLAYLF